MQKSLPQRASIVFIDDQPYFVRRYREALGECFELAYFDRVDHGIERAREHTQVAAVVVDVMMPPPEGVSDVEVDDGLATGLWVLNTLKSIVVERPMPVLLLTNRDIEAVQHGVKLVGVPPNFVDVCSKESIGAEQICAYVQRLIDSAAAEHRRRNPS